LSEKETQSQIDAFVVESRRLIGQVTKERQPWNTEVTADAIRHFAYGISDDNPLWLDSDHPSKRSSHRLIAPPAFLTSVLYPMVHGAPVQVPLSSLIGSLEFSWYRSMLEGDSLRATATLYDVLDSEDRDRRRVVYLISETHYWNQRSELVGKSKGTMARVSLKANELVVDRPIYQYSRQELGEIREALQHERRLRNSTLTAEDVKVGRSLPTLVRGPLTIGDMIAWQAAIGPSYRAGSLGYIDCLEAPHAAVEHPRTGWLIESSQQHEDPILTSQRGMPRPFDNGVMRFSWITPLLTNWMGAEGFLKRLSVKILAPKLYGDTIWYRGTVTDFIKGDKDAQVRVEISGVNQLGDMTTTGEAEVLLPKVSLKSKVTPTYSARRTDLEKDFEFRSVQQLIEMRVEETPQAVALQFGDQKLTYLELNRRANLVARHLRSGGVRPELLVGLCMDRNLNAIVGILGILKTGATIVPLDPEYPKERLAFMCNDAKFPLILTQEKLLDRLPRHNGKTFIIDSITNNASAMEEKNLATETGPNSPAYMIYTSGSTGQPKGVIVSHASLALYMQTIAYEIGVSLGDVFLQTASFSFSASVRQIMLPLSIGSTLVISNSEQRRDPFRLFKLIKDLRVTVWDTVPTILKNCIDNLLHLEEEKKRDLLSNRLRLILVTGEPLNWETARKWKNLLNQDSQIINLYSQTETSGTVASFALPRSIGDKSGVVPLGRPFRKVQVHLLNQNLEEAQKGNQGELCIGGGRIAVGYLNRPELTAEKFIPDPFSNQDGARLYRTGDFARYLPNGDLEYLGRVDNQVKIRGFRIELGEVEAMLKQHPGVKEAIVATSDHDDADNRLIAYLVPEQTADDETTAARRDMPLSQGNKESRVPSIPSLPKELLSLSDLKRYLGRRLPNFMVPSEFVIMEAFPLMANGKIDRQALNSTKGIRLQFENAYVAPRTAIESVLAGIWEELLKVDRIGIHANFFDLGGHSLLATQVISRANELFQTEVPVSIFFEAPTVSGLTEALVETIGDREIAEEIARTVTEIEGLSETDVKMKLSKERIGE